MKKVIILVLILVLFVTCFVGCNKQILDLNYKFNYAYVNCGDKIIEGSIKSWNDYDDSMVQVIFENGQVYYTHSSNIILVKKN